ncbi:MAG TPA: hypothetical protein VKI61_12995 [Chitinophagaceae bacterium]|jgi:hypothetical protein|nr:hypothetical protein [Chitinophagaceae bacterium]
MNGEAIYTVIHFSPQDLETLIKKTVSDVLASAAIPDESKIHFKTFPEMADIYDDLYTKGLGF